MPSRFQGRLPPLAREALAEFMATFILVVCSDCKLAFVFQLPSCLHVLLFELKRVSLLVVTDLWRWLDSADGSKSGGIRDVFFCELRLGNRSNTWLLLGWWNIR